MDISELRIAKELYLDLEAGRKASRNVVLLRPMLRIFYSYFFFLFTPEKRHYRPNSLSASTPPTSTCVEFFHNLVLIAVIDSGLYWATIVTSSSNADTRPLSLYLKTLKKKKMHTRTIDADKAALEKKYGIHIIQLYYIQL